MKPKNYPISKKLTAMNMLVSAVALLVACASFFTYDLFTFRAAVVRSLTVQAQLIASNTISALVFSDARSAEKTLSAFKASGHVVYAGIYSPSGQVFASYWRDGAGQPVLLSRLPQGEVQTYWFTRQDINLVRWIIFENKPLGIVYIRADLEAMSDRLENYALIVLVVLMGSLLAALLISWKAQSVISEPVIALAEISRAVSREKNYSIRAPATGKDDEISTLIDAFNEMLSQIQLRDGELQSARDNLEGRVKERTTELKRAQDNLRALSRRLLQMQDDERRRIARELHDSTGQLLVALSFNLSSIQNESPNWTPRSTRAIEESITLVESILQEVRTMSYLLHPPLLDDAGLDSAIHWFVQGFAERSGIPVELELPRDLGRLSRELEIAVFRIIQECLTNIHRHSGSPNATVTITRDAERVTVVVTDRGQGMRGDSVASPRGKVAAGVGIQGMKERVEQLGGTLQIRSDAAGTSVTAVMPVASRAIPTHGQL